MPSKIRPSIVLIILLLFLCIPVWGQEKTEATLRLMHNMVEKTNQERSARRLPPLKFQEDLTRAAVAHARDMAKYNYLGHYSPRAPKGEEDYDEYARAEHYDGETAENLYHGEPNGTGIITFWMGSPDHRSNILGTEFIEMGVGFARGKDYYDSYCVAFFGGRDASYPVVINNEAYSTSSATVRLYLYGKDKIRQMRFSNDGVTFSAWEPFKSEREWTLPPGEGLRTVSVELSDGEKTYKCSDSIHLIPPPDKPVP